MRSLGLGRLELRGLTASGAATRSLAPDDPMILSGYALACTRHWFFGSPGRAEQARRQIARELAAHQPS